MIKLIDSEATCGQIYNVGSTEEISILQLAELIIARLQSSSKVELVPYDKAYGEGFEDMQRRVPSIDRINETVGWQPTRTINDIIDDVATELR